MQDTYSLSPTKLPYSCLVGAATLLPVAATAQTTPAASEKLKPLLFLDGQWKGLGWIMLGPGKRSEFNQTETVERTLEGSLIAIEDRGTDKQDNSRVINHAFAAMAHDQAQRHLPHARPQGRWQLC